MKFINHNIIIHIYMINKIPFKLTPSITALDPAGSSMLHPFKIAPKKAFHSYIISILYYNFS